MTNVTGNLDKYIIKENGLKFGTSAAKRSMCIL
jgi:hypothetical protein